MTVDNKTGFVTSIKLDIKKYCIETASKRAYEHLICQYFDRSVSDDIKSSIEIQINSLKFFLEHADFNTLRHRYSELSGGIADQAMLVSGDHPKDWRIICNDNPIEPEWKDFIKNG